MKREDLTTEECQKVWDVVRECRVCEEEAVKTHREWFDARSIFFKKMTSENEEKLKSLQKLRVNARKKFEEASEIMELILDDWIELPDDDEF